MKVYPPPTWTCCRFPIGGCDETAPAPCVCVLWRKPAPVAPPSAAAISPSSVTRPPLPAAGGAGGGGIRRRSTPSPSLSRQGRGAFRPPRGRPRPCRLTLNADWPWIAQCGGPSTMSSMYARKSKARDKLDYMHNNPVKGGLVAQPGDWPWSSWRFYYLGDRSILALDRMP